MTTQLLYPYDISLETIVNLYYNGPVITARYHKFIVATVNGKQIACAEKFSKFPDGYDGYFVLSKSTKHENTVTRKEIMNKLPNVIFEEKEKSTYFKLKKFIEMNGRYPMNYENEELYHYIRDMCDARNELPISEIKRIEELPGWLWDYSRLTKEGQKFSEVITAVKTGLELTIEQSKALKLMNSKMDRKMLSVYFENEIRNLGLNI